MRTSHGFLEGVYVLGAIVVLDSNECIMCFVFILAEVKGSHGANLLDRLCFHLDLLVLLKWRLSVMEMEVGQATFGYYVDDLALS